MDTFKKIQDSKALFDLDGAQDEVTHAINSMAGVDCGEMLDGEGANGEDSLSQVEAVGIVKLRASAPWAKIEDGIRTLLEQFQSTADNEKLSHDARMTAADKILGVKAVQALCGNIFAEADTVVSSLKKSDVLALGTDYKDVKVAAKAARAVTKATAPAAVPEAPSNPRRYTPGEVAENTRRASEWIEKLRT